MHKYRKKPVVIEAFKWTADMFQTDDPLWIVEALKKDGGEGSARIRVFESDIYMEIHTLEGVHKAQRGDWIIRGIKGEIYPCKPDIFNKTYEKVND